MSPSVRCCDVHSREEGCGGDVAGSVWLSETWEWEERDMFYSGRRYGCEVVRWEAEVGPSR